MPLYRPSQCRSYRLPHSDYHILISRHRIFPDVQLDPISDPYSPPRQRRILVVLRDNIGLSGERRFQRISDPSLQSIASDRLYLTLYSF
jgi:hypothetical protein